MSDPYVEEYCSKRTYSCGFTTPIVTSNNKDTKYTVKEDVLITLKAGATTIDIQTRNRNLEYSENRSMTYNPGMVVATSYTNSAGDIYYVHCGNNRSGAESATFSDYFETLDTEILYMDLRNDTVVIKEVYNKIQILGTDSTSPKTTNIFTGYDASTYFTYVFDGIPIEETISFFIVIAGVKTLLHKEEVAKGFPYLALVMDTFPVSAWGIRFTEAWANEIEWYRQDLRKTPDKDGDAYLYYPEWCSNMGKMVQSLDRGKAGLKYELDHQLTQEDISGSYGSPEITIASMFYGSVAFDKDKNVFYSIATPAEYYKIDPVLTLNQKLLIKDVETEIPIDCECDVWYPIAPL